MEATVTISLEEYKYMQETIDKLQKEVGISFKEALNKSLGKDYSRLIITKSDIEQRYNFVTRERYDCDILLVEGYSEKKMNNKEKVEVDSSFIIKDYSDSAYNFERDLYRVINQHVGKGLKKSDLVHKMEYVTQSCRMS